MAKIDFFLSFNSANRAIADLVHRTVSDAGFSCFYQHEDIPDGANFVQRMTAGLTEAATVIALFSPAYFASRYALAELHAAFADDPLNDRGSILPLMIEPCVVPKPFNFLAFVDCRQMSADALRDRLQEMLAPYRKAPALQASRIPETNTAGAAQRLLDDLELAYAVFKSQCEVRNALVDAMCERDPQFELAQYEPFIARYFTAMTPGERLLHQRIREQTDTIEKLNRHALYCIEASREFSRRMPRLAALRDHLAAWLAKYDRTFDSDPSVGVLYVGVLEQKPFPVGIEDEIRRYIDEKKAAGG